jgi:hypothetical protein
VGDRELHTNSNALIYHPSFLALSQTELSKNFVINICVCYILDVGRFLCNWFLYFEILETTGILLQMAAVGNDKNENVHRNWTNDK